jgi:hypothetical protein
MNVQFQTDVLESSLALPLPHLDTMYRDVSSRIVDLERLEADIAERPNFHGVLELREDTQTWRLFYLNSVRLSSNWLDEAFRARALRLNAVHGSLSLHSLEPNLVRVLARLERGEGIALDGVTNALGLRELLARCQEVEASGLLRLHDPGSERADIFLSGGKVLHTASSARGFGVTLTTLLEQFESFSATLWLSESLPRALDLAPRRATWEVVLEAWSQVFERTQTAMDRQTPGSFNRAWREVGVQLATDYPVLDPFMTDLVWNGSRLALNTEAPHDLTQALVVGYLTLLKRLRLSPEVLFDAIDAQSLLARYRNCGLEGAFGRVI